MTNKTLLEKLERADNELKRAHQEEELYRLREENEKLLVIANNYQLILNKILAMIRLKYDNSFSLEDI